MMKRLLLCFLAALMCLSLAACNGRSNKEDDTTTEPTTTEAPTPDPEPPVEKQKVRVMTYNIWGMYPGEHSVGNRDALVSNVVHEYLPDVIGMQEYSPELYELKLQDKLADEYAMVDFSRWIANQEVANLYTPMFYRKSTVQLQSQGFLLFDRKYNNTTVNNKDSKGVAYAIFKTNDGQIFSVFNAHYWWQGEKNGGDIHDEARQKNSQDIIDLVNQYNLLARPVIIMGDMNCYVTSPAFQVLTNNGFTDTQGCAKETEDTRTNHSYPTRNPDDTYTGAPGVEGTSYTKKSIDHILISNAYNMCVEKFDIVTTEDALNSSDHCPVYVDLNFGLKETAQ